MSNTEAESAGRRIGKKKLQETGRDGMTILIIALDRSARVQRFLH